MYTSTPADVPDPPFRFFEGLAPRLKKIGDGAETKETQVEEMLISGVLPIMFLYRLPHGQYGYSGHVINLPQDVGSFANTLPRLPSELDVIVVIKEGATESHHDFLVRRSVVLRALQWLLANNIYRNVHIDSDALALLPEDGNLTGLCSMTLESSDDDQLVTSTGCRPL